MKIKELRIKNGFSQQEIAKFLNVSQSNYSKYERNEIEPDIQTLIKLADYFHTTVDNLIDHKVPYLIDKSTWSDNKKELLSMIENLNDYECEKVKGIIIGCTQAINELPKRIK